MKILVAEDDSVFVEFITRALSESGHEIIVAADGLAAVRYLEKSLADLVILDWTLPNMSGIDVLRWVRKNLGYKIPVMFLTNRVFEYFISEALDAGADEYVTKPIGERQLLSRVNAIERRLRSSINVPMVIEVGNFRIDNYEKSVLVNGSRVTLNPKEFELAYALFANYGCIVPRSHLATMIWGRPEDAFFRPLDSAIYRIRSKLRLNMENGVVLKSIYKIGYRLDGR
ncbi:response regulator transcription factor [Burkholderia ubonensis]|uniref:response regulator transcription factor n=1 Tax=Burkholderia ubonensis TaxID=101571 RepID=UPI0009B3CC72|nr:response regulator transcription factor [Burkholderia ubonensis]